jgi:PEP-CTERM motif
MKRNGLLAALFFVGLFNVLDAHAFNNSNIDTRVDNRLITFDDLTFANALSSFSTVATVNSFVGDIGIFNILFNNPNITNFTAISGTGITLINTIPPTGGNNMTASIMAVVTGTQGTTFGYTGQNPNINRITSGGYYELDFSNNTWGLLRVGGTAIYEVTLPGNWSQQGTGIGDVQLISLNSGFSITQDFVYNALINQTVFEAVDNNYASGNTGTNLEIILHGAIASVPEPGTCTLMLAGLGLLFTVFRRKSNQQ